MFFTVSKLVWLLAEPSMLIALLLTGGLVCSRYGSLALRRIGAKLFAAASILMLIAGFSPLGNALAVLLEERFARADLSAGQAPIAGIVILGGALMPELSAKRGEFSLNEAAERLTEAVLLARRFPSAKVLFSGGSGQLAGEVAEATGAGEFLRQMGIAGERILLETLSRNTYENAVFARQAAIPKPGERWLLVTSAFHMPRSMACFRKAGFVVEPWPVDYRTKGPGDAMRFSDGIADGLKRFDVVTKEYVGLLVYRLRGRTDALWPGPLDIGARK